MLQASLHLTLSFFGLPVRKPNSYRAQPEPNAVPRDEHYHKLRTASSVHSTAYHMWNNMYRKLSLPYCVPHG